MNEDLDGPRPDGVEGTQQVAGGLGIEAVDYLSFAEHDEGLWDGESHGGSKKKCLTNLSVRQVHKTDLL